MLIYFFHLCWLFQDLNLNSCPARKKPKQWILFRALKIYIILFSYTFCAAEWKKRLLQQDTKSLQLICSDIHCILFWLLFLIHLQKVYQDTHPSHPFKYWGSNELASDKITHRLAWIWQRTWTFDKKWRSKSKSCSAYMWEHNMFVCDVVFPKCVIPLSFDKA